MNELLAILPYKFILAASSYLPALIVLSLGQGSIAVGFITSVSVLGTLFGPVVWSRFALITNRKYMVAMAYLGLVFGLFLLMSPKWIYLAVFILSLFPQAAYFVALAEIRRKKGSLGESLGRLEEAVGIVWALGLALGFLGTEILGLDQFAVLLAGIGMLSIPIVTRAIGEFSVSRTVMDGLDELKKLEIWAIGAFGKLKIKHPQIHFKKEALSLYIFGIIYSFASGIIYTQLPTLLDMEFGAARMVYICVFIDALASAAIFRMAGLLRDRSYIYGYITRTIGYSILIAAIGLKNMFGVLLFYFMSGVSWGFIMMFFEYSGLKLGEKVFGTFLFFRLVSYALASGISGFMIDTLGFFNSFTIGFVIFLLTFFFYTGFEKEKKKVFQGYQPNLTPISPAKNFKTG